MELLCGPIPFIEVDEHDQFILNAEASNLLKNIKDPVYVVSAVGLYRTGKSSLLNWIVGRKSGFVIGSTVNRCTRGIWVFESTIRTTLANGIECRIIILDTEGIGGIDADNEYDSRILSLAVLLSNTLLYNSMGTINENTINNLSFITQLTKCIRINCPNNPTDARNNNEEDDESLLFHQFFPRFVWVVRDFTLDLVDKNNQIITSSEYLESALKPIKGYDKQTFERNRIRQMISTFFPRRNCVTLVRPILNEKQLQEVDQIPFDDLRPEFQSGVKELRNILFNEDKALNSITGHPLTGSMFLDLVKAYLTSINNGGIPTVTSAWDDVSKKAYHTALHDAVDIYQSEMIQISPLITAPTTSTTTTNPPSHPSPISSPLLLPINQRMELPVEDTLLNSTHNSAYEKAVTYLQQYVKNNEDQKALNVTLQDTLLSEYQQLQFANRNASTAYCQLLLTSLYDTHIRHKLWPTSATDDVHSTNILDTTTAAIDVNNYLHSCSYLTAADGINAFQQDCQDLYHQYLNHAKGPSIYSSYCTFATTQLAASYRLLFHTLRHHYEGRLLVIQRESEQERRDLSGIRGERNQLQEMLSKQETTQRELEVKYHDLTAHYNQQSTTLTEMTTTKRQLERALEEEKDIKDRAMNTIASLKDRIEKLELKEEECENLKWIISCKNDDIATLQHFIGGTSSARLSTSLVTNSNLQNSL